MGWCAHPPGPWEDADRISLHPWEFACSVFWTSHHKQLNLSFQLDSAPISVPTDSNLLNWVRNIWQRPLWHRAPQSGREEKELFQSLLIWIRVWQQITFYNLPVWNGRCHWHAPLGGMKIIQINNYIFLSILYCRCTYSYLYLILNMKFLSWKGETFTIKIEWLYHEYFTNMYKYWQLGSNISW